MNTQCSVSVARDLYDIGEEHGEHPLRWVAQTGLSVAALTACVLAAATWLMFSLRYAVATRVGAVLLAAAGLVLSANSPALGAPGAGYPEPVVSVLAVITLLAICAVSYLSAPSTERPDTRDPALPEVGWLVALPFYLLTYAVAFSAMFSSLDLSDSVFAGGGNLLSAVQYAIAVLGFAFAGILRSRATATYAPLAGVAGVVVCLPLAVGAPLLAAATAHPVTRPVIDLALLVVLIRSLLWLARHRTAARRLGPATTAAATDEPIDKATHMSTETSTNRRSQLMSRTGRSNPAMPAAYGSGESRQDLIGQALAAPGALLHSTTKPDLLEFAALATSRTSARPTARRN